MSMSRGWRHFRVVFALRLASKIQTSTFPTSSRPQHGVVDCPCPPIMVIRNILCVAEKNSIAKAVAGHLGGHVQTVNLKLPRLGRVTDDHRGRFEG
jgi:hypothetical protein